MTQVFTVTGMHCGSCGLLIDETLEELPGVSRAQTDVRRSRTTIEGDHVAVEEVVTAIAALGFHATVTAGP